jgi:hypothetical protein
MTNQNLTPRDYASERKFVEAARKIVLEPESEVALFAYQRWATLQSLSCRCKAGDLEARKLWDELPQGVRNFWPSLNYLNKETIQ